ncbi:MAG: murein biosynthesis integral membrane protein MurJ, partial [bacterium]
MSNRKKNQSERGRIVRAAGVVGSATFLSRLLGLVRDAVLAFLYGATPAADAFFVAFRIPNLMRQLLGEGALAAAFVPIYTDIRDREGQDEANRFSAGIFSLLSSTLLVLTLLGIIFAPQVVRIIAYGFEPGGDIYSLTVQLVRWMFPYMLLVCVAALMMGVLNAHMHFLTPALAPALLNISIIFFALAVSQNLEKPILGIAWGVLVGGLLQILVQWPPLLRRGIVPWPRLKMFTPGVRRLGIMMGPAVLGVAVYQVNILIDTLIASFLPGGSITYLWYGNRMMQFPLGVFGIALATAALPTLSQQVSEGREGDFSRTVSFAIGMTAFIGLPASMGLIALREPIMVTLFARGAFGPADVAGAAAALQFYAIGLIFFIGIKILGRAFYAMENTVVPFLAAGCALIVNVVFNLILMGPMKHAGLAFATSIASLVNFAVLAVIFTRKTDRSWAGMGLFGEVAKAAAAS